MNIMNRINVVKAEQLLNRAGLGAALDHFDRFNRPHSIYTRDYSLNVVSLVYDLSLLADIKNVSNDLLISALFLRLVANTDDYNIKHVLNSAKVFLGQNSRHMRLNSQKVLSYLSDQETNFPPLTSPAMTLHDAEILTFLMQPATNVVAFVSNRTGLSKSEATANLVALAVKQRMYTRMGRLMLQSVGPDVVLNLQGATPCPIP